MSEQKFPPKILGSYDPESNNGRWQGPYQFCPEQWCIAYEKLGHTWAPTPGETRDVVFISEEEHQHLMAENERRIERLREALHFLSRINWDETRVRHMDQPEDELWKLIIVARAALQEETK